eukprot:5846550-Lingulodinium_polyedra.AAC.1
MGLRVCNTFGEPAAGRSAAATWRRARRRKGRWHWHSQIDYVAAPASLAAVARPCAWRQADWADHRP